MTSKWMLKRNFLVSYVTKFLVNDNMYKNTYCLFIQMTRITNASNVTKLLSYHNILRDIKLFILN